MSRTALAGCYVISLRPVGGHAALRRAAAAHGAHVLALSPWKLAACDDAGTRRDLQSALDCPKVIVSSPAAVAAACALAALHARPEQQWFAIGTATAHALRRAGIDVVATPARMDSEGLLALPGLQDVAGSRIGLVTAPGGRNEIGTALVRRGATLLRADVYRRQPVAPSPRAIAALCALDAAIWLPVSSGEALQRTLATLPERAVQRLRRARVVAASARLAALSRASGFTDVVVAASALPRDLVATMASASMAAPGLATQR